MNDIEFIETLKQKRNACDYSQSRLAQELQISRQNLNEIENGKTKASKEMKHILLHYLDYCNCTQPFTLTIDYLRVRFPTTDALEIIKNVLAMKSEYFIHEDYGMFGYEEQYIYGAISVNASKDSSMGVLLELRGMVCSGFLEKTSCSIVCSAFPLFKRISNRFLISVFMPLLFCSFSFSYKTNRKAGIKN